MIPANDNDHQVHERAWVIVLDGEVEIKTSAGNSVTGRSGLLGRVARMARAGRRMSRR